VVQSCWFSSLVKWLCIYVQCTQRAWRMGRIWFESRWRRLSFTPKQSTPAYDRFLSLAKQYENYTYARPLCSIDYHWYHDFWLCRPLFARQGNPCSAPPLPHQVHSVWKAWHDDAHPLKRAAKNLRPTRHNLHISVWNPDKNWHFLLQTSYSNHIDEQLVKNLYFMCLIINIYKLTYIKNSNVPPGY
jgi:hypothetical protein